VAPAIGPDASDPAAGRWSPDRLVESLPDEAQALTANVSEQQAVAMATARFTWRSMAMEAATLGKSPKCAHW
jgi:hypothetical protein